MSDNKTEIVTSGTIAMSPAQMIMQAVQSNADLDKVKGLLELQIAWEANEARKAYHRAMSEFKSVPIEIEKNRSVGYDSKTGGKVGYKHATLDNVVRVITAELSKHGLSASWRTEQPEGKVTVICKITHVLGHSEETPLTAKADSTGSKNEIQALGSTITYLERYTLLAATGLATSDQDDDGKSADVFINDFQIKEIKDAIQEKSLTTEKFLEFMGAESVEKIKASEYTKAVNAIKSAKKK